jgi:hypothetical protein
MTKMNSRMRGWIDKAIVGQEEPFTAREIYEKILRDRPNSNYITSVYSVGSYLSRICIKQRNKEYNIYWRK